ncbi:hypothetical protein GIB67_014672 [Kingdonia uniflora]|uniref:Integrator complex subunit 7-like C-terminal domain-containing protein n=1 Tax=Kingdonia uniflora TaxID=39325 RepID=A0A7J7NE38_9MAGN|nr:hypothetical protein GIB67_014672 [Kingdonia uniflora]
MVNCGGERKLDSYADTVATKLVCCLYRFVETCIEILDEVSAVTTQIHHILKLLVENIHGSNLFSQETCFNYSILLHSHVNKNKESSNWIEHERVILRSCSSAELFAFNADTTNGNKLSVKPVFHLSLNLCVQLINPPVRLRKLHCILSAKPSTETPETWDPEEAVDLYEKLMLHVSQDVNSSSGKHRRVCGGGDGSVCFNINVTGHQGFSTCLLDVSAFPVGSYKMKWQGCSTVTEGSPYWSPVPLNMGIVFSVKVPPIVSS